MAHLTTLAQVDQHITTPQEVRESIEDFLSTGWTLKEITDWLVKDLAADGTQAERLPVEQWVRRETLRIQGLIKVTAEAVTPEGQVLIERETRPGGLGGGVLTRWIVAPAAETEIVGLQLRSRHDATRYVIVHPSMRTGYKWQATWFDADGAGGDIQRKDLAAALYDMAPASGYDIEEIEMTHGRKLTTRERGLAHLAEVVARDARENPSPAMPTKAIRMFRLFHTRDYRGDGAFHPSLTIPATVRCMGDALRTDYRSDKLNPTDGDDEGWIDYTHKHDGGVKLCQPARGASGDTNVPAWIRNVDQLTWLGKVLALEFRDGDGVHEMRGTEPLPELFASPTGKALFVIQSKRTLLAIIWGGRLAVERRGIVH